MINRSGVVGSRQRLVIALDDGFQAAPEQSEVGSVIVDAVRLYWGVIVWRDHIEVFWAKRLNDCEQIAVEAQLDDRAGSGRAHASHHRVRFLKLGVALSEHLLKVYNLACLGLEIRRRRQFSFPRFLNGYCASLGP
jgi:hypothetical protein